MTDSISPIKPAKTSNQRSQSWRVFLVIALILALWSLIAALFLLAIVWIMRRNPDRDSSFVAGKTEKSTARRVYIWLFFSSFITVPVFILVLNESYSSYSTNNQNVLSALVPLIFHLPLLFGLISKSVFVYRHTQQGIMLIALRAGTAALAISVGDEAGLMLFLLLNGLLWIFGSIWGWTQVTRGECWWMKQKGESMLPAGDEFEALTPQKHIERSREFINRYDSKRAKMHALAAFRRADADVKRQAVKVLDVLDEVEFF